VFDNFSDIRMSHLGHQTVASLLKSKPPVPYANMLRQVTNHIKKLQEELQAESSTNIEFEESSRRSFEFLTQQLKALKQAFNTLSDTLLEELEHISHTVTQELQNLKEDPRVPKCEKEQEFFRSQLTDFSTETFEKMKRLAEQDVYLESKIEQLNSDMDTVLQVIPKMEDSFIKGDAQLQERQSALGVELSKLNDIIAVERCKSNSSTERIEARMKELSMEFDEKILRCQKSLQQQMEYVSRLVITRGPSLGEPTTIVDEVKKQSPKASYTRGSLSSPFRSSLGGGGQIGGSPGGGLLSSKIGQSASAKFPS